MRGKCVGVGWIVETEPSEIAAFSTVNLGVVAGACPSTKGVHLHQARTVAARGAWYCDLVRVLPFNSPSRHQSRM
jgi:hypothetical protein